MSTAVAFADVQPLTSRPVLVEFCGVRRYVPVATVAAPGSPDGNGMDCQEAAGTPKFGVPSAFQFTFCTRVDRSPPQLPTTLPFDEVTA